MSVFERIDRKIHNMSGMLLRFGIDPATFAKHRLGSLFTASMHACQTCPSGDLCERWLETAGRIARIPEFCPNGRHFEIAKAMLGENSRPN